MNDNGRHISECMSGGFNIFLVVADWFLGVFLGCLFYFYVSEFCFAWMRSVCYGAVSIVGLLTVVFLPLLLAALAFFCSQSIFLHFLILGKAVLYTMATFSCFDTLGSEGWVLQMLLLFGDNIGAVILLFTSVCAARHSFAFSLRSFAYSTIAGVAAVLLSYIWISPLLRSIFV